MELGSKIQSEVQSEMDKTQREYLLREQMNAIRRELGEEDEAQAEINELRQRMEEAGLPEDVRKQAERELSRLEKLPPAAAEHGVIRTYLEWILDLPWNKSTEDNLDIAHARKVLDADHYDIEKVKDRILDHLAVRKLKPDARGSILSFVGPPGVGKTSLGKSIAKALGRKFERISVGGVRDEAEIRGHRRTYIGAMPGTIIRALRDAELEQPRVHDRRDRQDGRGLPRRPRERDARGARPRAELTRSATTTSTCRSTSRTSCSSRRRTSSTAIPAPLRDRMEVIQLSGYTAEEKHEIARRYLVPRQIERNGLTPEQIEIKDEVIDIVIRDYTREAGVRNLERELGTLCRKVAREFAEGKAKRQGDRHAREGARDARPPALLLRGRAAALKEPGVATGLAWTPVGGDVLFVEATAYAGTGKLIITGQLGDVMKESAQAALSFVRAHVDAAAAGPAGGLLPDPRPAHPRARPARSRRTGPPPASRWRPRSPR